MHIISRHVVWGVVESAGSQTAIGGGRVEVLSKNSPDTSRIQQFSVV